MFKGKKGFTLIEMLIVIAVIGVLAVAVLSAINPVEQMRKARDTRRRSSAAELLNAIERYYTTNEENPPAMVTGAGTDDTCSAALLGGNVTSADLADLVSDNEIKQEFITRVTGSLSDYLYVGIDPASDLVTVCYEIEASSNESMIDCPTAATLTADIDLNCLPE